MLAAARPIRPGLWLFLVGAASLAGALGFVREATIAALFGATADTDAFYLALSLPFVAAQFVVGGAVVPPLTASLARALATDDFGTARALLGRCAATLVPAAAATAAVGALAAPALMKILAPGFGPPALGLAVVLFRILLLHGLLTAGALVASAPLLAAGAWHIPPLAFLAANSVSVVVLLAARPLGIAAAAWGLVAGAAVHLAVQLPVLARANLWPSAPRDDARLPFRTMALLLVSLLAAGAVELAERPFASTAGAGGVALLAFASKLVHLPMRLLAAPLASVLVPRIAGGEIRKDPGVRSEARVHTLLTAALLLAATIFTGLFSGPIARAAFGRGRFGPEQLAGLAAVLRWMAPAVLAVGLIEVGSKFLLAEGRTWLVVLAQSAGLVTYLVAAPFLLRAGAPGLGLARALSWGIVAVLLSWAIASRRAAPPAPPRQGTD